MDTTYGALFICLVLGTILYGITVIQTYLYYRQYPNDSRLMRSFVFLLFLLDTTHLVLITIEVYGKLITNFNNPDALLRPSWAMILQIDCNGLIGLLVQCFFARRVKIMSRSVILPVVIVIFGCITFGLGVYLTIETFLLEYYSGALKFVWLIATGMGSAAAADVIIAAALCYCLSKSRTGFARTDSLINTLIMYSLATGLATSILALLCVILFVAMRKSFAWVGIFWILGKFYVNSTLVALNCRDSLREKLATGGNPSLHLTPLSASASSGYDAVKSLSSGRDTKEEYPNVGKLAVNVQVEMHSRVDNEHLVSLPSTVKTVRQ